MTKEAKKLERQLEVSLLIAEKKFQEIVKQKFQNDMINYKSEIGERDVK